MYSNDERRILTWGKDGTVRQWDAATGTQIGAPLVHDAIPGAILSDIAGATFSKDDRRILSYREPGRDHFLTRG